MIKKFLIRLNSIMKGGVKMKKITIFGLMIALLLIAGANAQAAIMDNYYGNFDNGNGKGDRDVIGGPAFFEISQMDVSRDASNLYVDIQTNYLYNIGHSNTQLGDLFVSIDGWQVMGSGPHYYDDDYTNGGWEYALVLDDHTNTSGGTLSLYAIDSTGSILLSNYFDALHNWGPDGVWYRSDQEVQYSTTANALAIGTWSISGDILNFTIDKSLFANADLAFHWAPTCANDVFEGTVPEPSTLLLLGAGLLGLGFAARRRK